MASAAVIVNLWKGVNDELVGDSDTHPKRNYGTLQKIRVTVYKIGVSGRAIGSHLQRCDKF